MLLGFRAGAEDTKLVTDKLNKTISNISFTATEGKPATLKELMGKKATVVLFLSFDCPVARSYSTTLAELHAAYANKGVAFVGVLPTDDNPAEVAKRAAEYKIPFTVVTDPTLTAADAFKAITTPEAFVLDAASVLRYRGRIDNAFHARLKRNPQVTEFDLKNAIEDVLADKDVAVPATMAVGAMC